MYVYNSSADPSGVRYRRYRCRRCGARVSTREIPEVMYQDLRGRKRARQAVEAELTQMRAKYDRLYTICCGLLEKWKNIATND